MNTGELENSFRYDDSREEFFDFSISSLFSSHQGEILCMTVSHNNEYIVTGSRDRFITVLRLESGEVEHSVEQHTDAITSLALTQDDVLLISGWHITTNLESCFTEYSSLLHLFQLHVIKQSNDGHFVECNC